jgi:predicted metal-dependent hydrolase
MQVNYNREFRGPEKAKKLNLHSSRFKDTHMTHRAKEAIEYVKRKDRSYLTVSLP